MALGTEEEGVVETANGAESPAQTADEALIKQWSGRITAAKAHPKIEKAFKRMEADMQFARGIQWQGQKDLDEPRYTANIVQRHLRQREAALYAKNPTAVAKRRRTLDFAEWDGNPQAIMQAQQIIMQAQQAMQQAQQMGDMQTIAMMQAQMQEAQSLLMDYQEGSRRRTQLDKMARTMEIVWQHQTGEQQPPFKSSMKHLVRRALTTGVGYLKLGYHRFNEQRPEDLDRVTDLTEQVASLRARMAEMREDDSGYDEASAELSELQHLVEKVHGEQESFVREGLDFDFPRATQLLIDPECYQLDGFLGAEFVAQEFLLSPQQIRSVYGANLGTDYKPFTPDGKQLSPDNLTRGEDGTFKPDTRVRVWEVWNKRMGQTFTIAEGHGKWLVAPKTPDVYIERFWPFFVLVFNGLEDEEELFPPSDVRLLRDMQTERNLMRQRLREHRDAARPGHITPRGKLDDTDKQRLQNRDAHDVVELNIGEQDDVRRILQPIPTTPIDPNQYDVNQLENDIYKVVGTQEAVMGGVSGATATETSISESARLSAIGSSVDELDDFLTQVAKSSSQLLLSEMSEERVKEIAGRGALWPQLSGAEIAKDLWLEIRAGSSGRPNKSNEIQNLERLLPFIQQMPGVRPDKIFELVAERLDDRLDPEEFMDMALPSMAAMNRQAATATGGPDEDPNQQGGEGGDTTSVAQGDSNMGPRPPGEERNMDPNR